MIQLISIQVKNTRINIGTDESLQCDQILPQLQFGAYTQMRTNSKLPPMESQSEAKSNFILSLHSKKKPFVSSKHKLIIEQYDSDSICQSQKKFFPVGQFKDFLKGEKIYLEIYYNKKVFLSGYEPYIEAMGGQVMKRITSSTTTVLTNEMPHQDYIRLKSKIQKVCRPGTLILSILWFQEIYRQKRKVQKQPFIFDQQTDILNFIQQQPQEQQEDFQHDQFYQQLIAGQFAAKTKQYLKNSKQKDFIQTFEPRKNKQTQFFMQEGIIYIEPIKQNVYLDQFEEQKYKKSKNQHEFISFISSNKKNKERKSIMQQNQTKQQKKNSLELQKKRRSTVRLSVNGNKKLEHQGSHDRNKEKLKIQNAQSENVYNQDKQNVQIQGKQEVKPQDQEDEGSTQFQQRMKKYEDGQSLNTILNKYLCKQQKSKNQQVSSQSVTKIFNNSAQTKSVKSASKDRCPKKIQQQQNNENMSDQQMFDQDGYCYREQTYSKNDQFQEPDAELFYAEDQHQEQLHSKQQVENENFNGSNISIQSNNGSRKILSLHQKNNNKTSHDWAKTPTQQKFARNNAYVQQQQHIEKTKTNFKPSDSYQLPNDSKYIQTRIKLVRTMVRAEMYKFLQKINYKFDTDQVFDQIDTEQAPIMQENQPKASIIFNVIVKNSRIIDQIKIFNSKSQQRLSQERQFQFNVINFQNYNKMIKLYPSAEFFVNFQKASSRLYASKDKKIIAEQLRNIIGLKQASQQESGLLYDTLCRVILQIGEQLQIYCLSSRENTEDVLLLYLAEVEQQNILDTKVLSQVFEFLASNSKRLHNSQKNLPLPNISSKSHSMKDNSQNLNSNSQNLNNNSHNIGKNSEESFQKNEESFQKKAFINPEVVKKLKERIKEYIFPKYQIKAELTTQRIRKKHIACIKNDSGNFQFIVMTCGAKVVKALDFMSKNVKVDILVSGDDQSKRTVSSKYKNVQWQINYLDFINSLIRLL